MSVKIRAGEWSDSRGASDCESQSLLHPKGCFSCQSHEATVCESSLSFLFVCLANTVDVTYIFFPDSFFRITTEQLLIRCSCQGTGKKTKNKTVRHYYQPVIPTVALIKKKIEIIYIISDHIQPQILYITAKSSFVSLGNSLLHSYSGTYLQTISLKFGINVLLDSKRWSNVKVV